VFVNYGRPIPLREYMKNIGVPEVTHENINEASLRLSEKLYKEH